jgi:hypothetical protein
MPRYLLHHKHDPAECGAVFASFTGDASPLRHQPTIGSCLFGGHTIWWDVNAPSEAEALELLPSYIAQRTTMVAIATVNIP